MVLNENEDWCSLERMYLEPSLAQCSLFAVDKAGNTALLYATILLRLNEPDQGTIQTDGGGK
jgi:hypothetical protein